MYWRLNLFATASNSANYYIMSTFEFSSCFFQFRANFAVMELERGHKDSKLSGRENNIRMAFPFFMLSPVPYVDIFVSFLEKVKERI